METTSIIELLFFLTWVACGWIHWLFPIPKESIRIDNLICGDWRDKTRSTKFLSFLLWLAMVQLTLLGRF